MHQKHPPANVATAIPAGGGPASTVPPSRSLPAGGFAAGCSGATTGVALLETGVPSADPPPQPDPQPTNPTPSTAKTRITLSMRRVCPRSQFRYDPCPCPCPCPCPAVRHRLGPPTVQISEAPKCADSFSSPVFSSPPPAATTAPPRSPFHPWPSRPRPS